MSSAKILKIQSEWLPHQAWITIFQRKISVKRYNPAATVYIMGALRTASYCDVTCMVLLAKMNNDFKLLPIFEENRILDT